jgi:protein farnesyltransferase subunit beta
MSPMRHKGVSFPWKQEKMVAAQQHHHRRSVSNSPSSRAPTPAQHSQQQTSQATTSSPSAAASDTDSVIDGEIPIHTHQEQQPNPANMIPDLFTQYPLVRDPLVTQTSQVQDETVEACLPFLRGEEPEDGVFNEHGVPGLDREKHLNFLRQWLGKLPGRFIALDAGRPWFLYWCLSAMTLLGEDVTPYRAGVVETARTMQNPDGGFGGGGGQLSHLATSYAVVLAIALVGGEEAYEVIDRKAMWRWLGRLKQPDGGFQVCVGGEEDIR